MVVQNVTFNYYLVTDCVKSQNRHVNILICRHDISTSVSKLFSKKDTGEFGFTWKPYQKPLQSNFLQP